MGKNDKEQMRHEEDPTEESEARSSLQLQCWVSDTKVAVAASVSRVFIDIEVGKARNERDGCTSASKAGNAVRYITFRNHYVAWITIKVLEIAKNGRNIECTGNNIGEQRPTGKYFNNDRKDCGVWKTLLSQYNLMKDVHCEIDAQQVHVVTLPEYPEKNYTDCPSIGNHEDDCQNISAIRIYLYQPSPRWNRVPFTLSNVAVYGEGEIDLSAIMMKYEVGTDNLGSSRSFHINADPHDQYLVPIFLD